MTRSLSICFVILELREVISSCGQTTQLLKRYNIFCSKKGLTGVSQEVSSKVEFDEISPIITNSSKEDDDVEVKHTIVVSTKLKNNNRRGLHGSGDTDSETYRLSPVRPVKEDSEEVPIVRAFKSVETTQIRTPDTRIKSTTYPNFNAFNSNPRDELDLYHNIAVNPMQWKPSPVFNNVNWRNQGSDNFDNYIRINRPDYQKIHRRITDDGVREFYCKKCRELSGSRGCVQRRSNSWVYETTTPKIKVDGKLENLN